MNYKLKSVQGKVTFLLRTGKDLVKNQMAVASAQHIIDTGKTKKSDVPGYPINIDDKWYFEGKSSRKPLLRRRTLPNENFLHTICPALHEVLYKTPSP